MADAVARVTSPGELGLSARAILDFLKAAGELDIHALAVVKDGRAYALAKRPYTVDSPHTLFSLSKSFCAMAAGFAVGEGRLRYEDSVAEVLADCLPEEYDKKLRGVTLHHLLSMSSGLDEKSDYEIREGNDWARAALSYRVVHEPGTHFHYNTMGTYLAGRMVSRAVGQGLRDYLMPRLFTPLGIAKPQWDCCPMGFNAGGFGLHLSVMDIARTASLLLADGKLNGKRLLPAEFMKRATKKQVENRNPEEQQPHPDWSSGYGYQFWMAPHGRYRGDGMFGQVMLIDRKAGLSVCCTAGTNLMGDELDALHRLLDALIAGKPDMEDDKALARFEKRWAVRAPRDSGESLGLEGSYAAKDGKTLRVEQPDGDSLRLYFKAPDFPVSTKLGFGRKKPWQGLYLSWPQGERPQICLGRFGVQGGVLTAQATMPEAPYRLLARLSLEKGGLRLEMDGIGFDSGSWLFQPSDTP